jgi:hypothetical protein
LCILFLPFLEIKERYGPKKVQDNNNINELPNITVQNDNNSNQQQQQNGEKPFSYQNFSDEMKKKNCESSLLISNSQLQIGAQAAKEISDFATENSKNLLVSIKTAERRSSQESEATAEITKFASPNNLLESM